MERCNSCHMLANKYVSFLLEIATIASTKTLEAQRCSSLAVTVMFWIQRKLASFLTFSYRQCIFLEVPNLSISSSTDVPISTLKIHSIGFHVSFWGPGKGGQGLKNCKRKRPGQYTLVYGHPEEQKRTWFPRVFCSLHFHSTTTSPRGRLRQTRHQPIPGLPTSLMWMFSGGEWPTVSTVSTLC